MNVCVCKCACMRESLWEGKSMHVQPTHQLKSSHHYTTHTILQVNQVPADQFPELYSSDVPRSYFYVLISSSHLTLMLTYSKCHLSVMQHQKLRVRVSPTQGHRHIHYLSNFIKSLAQCEGFRKSPNMG